jgi:hypothetical protein
MVPSKRPALPDAHERGPAHVRETDAKGRVSDRSTPGAFLGDWRITTMELWAKDAIELLGPRVSGRRTH